MKSTLDVFVGFDSRQPVAAAVAAYSVARHATMVVPITQLRLDVLPIQRRGLTEFTYSRFLAPFLSGFQGISLFIDSDVLCRGDVFELLSYTVAYPEVPVFAVPHLMRFERPSVMLFNNALCQKLTPEYIDDPAHNLFDFGWAESVGELPHTWNHLVGYDPPNRHAKLVHFTKGIPCWKETERSEFAVEWRAMCLQLGSTVSFEELMGRSVHVQ